MERECFVWCARSSMLGEKGPCVPPTGESKPTCCRNWRGWGSLWSWLGSRNETGRKEEEIKRCSSNKIFWWHGSEHDARRIPKMDMVIGSRMVGGLIQRAHAFWSRRWLLFINTKLKFQIKKEIGLDQILYLHIYVLESLPIVANNITTSKLTDVSLLVCQAGLSLPRSHPTICYMSGVHIFF